MKLRRKHKKIILSLVLAVVVLSALLVIIKSVLKPNMAAKVNDDSITLKELDYFYNRVIAVDPEATKDAVLDQLIANKLLLQEATEENIAVTDQEIDLIIQDTEKVYQKNIDELVKDLGVSEKDLKEKVREQLLIKRLLDKYITVSVTDEELKKLYEENKEKFKLNRAVNVSHILLESEEEALEVKSMIESGADFYQLAREKSKDPGSKNKSGNIGFVEQGQTVKEFEDTIFKLNKGDIEGPIKTTYGYHIIKIEDIREEKELSFNEVKDKLKELFTEQKKKEAYTKYIRKLLSEAKIKKYI